MKICVIGPLSSPRYFGGVATFCEELSEGFARLGHEVVVITEFTTFAPESSAVRVVSVYASARRKNILSLFKIAKWVRRESPDLVVTSLEYGLVTVLVKRKLPRTKFFHFLHGYPVYTGSRLRSLRRKLLVNVPTKLITKFSHEVIANSGVTSLINKELYNFKVSGVVNLGVGVNFLRSVNHQTAVRQENTILFVGRLTRDKKVHLLLESVYLLPQAVRDGVTVNIVGDGEERSALERQARDLGIHTVFHGRRPPSELVQFYQTNKIFVSLNAHEPYGIVYLEALACACLLVCPYSGGQMDFYHTFHESIFPANPYRPGDIAEKIRVALTRSNHSGNKEIIQERFTYMNVAQDILTFI